jgi:flagellar hook assembly protein FlgD
VSGREVRVLFHGEVAAGSHDAVWDGRDAAGRPLPAGTYFYELTAGGERMSRRMIRLP